MSRTRHAFTLALTAVALSLLTAAPAAAAPYPVPDDPTGATTGTQAVLLTASPAWHFLLIAAAAALLAATGGYLAATHRTGRSAATPAPTAIA